MRLSLAPYALICSLFPLSFALAATSPGGKPMNPDIGVNFLGLAQTGTAYSDTPTAKPRNGLQLQEAEVQFSSDVDPYLRASVMLAVEQENGSADYKINPEEVFIETISLPVVTLKAGRFKPAIGKHNQLHTHAFPFIDAPLIHQRLLGDEGLLENAVSASALFPTSWFSELTLQAITLNNATLFNHYANSEMGGVARWRNLWELNPDTTLELGISGLQGKNSIRGRHTSVWGSDLTVKWRPAEGGKYHALTWSTEYLYGVRGGFTKARDVTDPVTGTVLRTVQDSTANLAGIASWVQWQFAQRWWLQGRYEYLGLPADPVLNQASKESALIAFLPSEFSSFRLQYDWVQDSARPRKDHALALQYNIAIGAHPAHAY